MGAKRGNFFGIFVGPDQLKSPVDDETPISRSCYNPSYKWDK